MRKVRRKREHDLPMISWSTTGRSLPGNQAFARFHVYSLTLKTPEIPKG